jgi:hypothetical protein
MILKISKNKKKLAFEAEHHFSGVKAEIYSQNLYR